MILIAGRARICWAAGKNDTDKRIVLSLRELKTAVMAVLVGVRTTRTANVIFCEDNLAIARPLHTGVAGLLG